MATAIVIFFIASVPCSVLCIKKGRRRGTAQSPHRGEGLVGLPKRLFRRRAAARLRGRRRRRSRYADAAFARRVAANIARRAAIGAGFCALDAVAAIFRGTAAGRAKKAASEVLRGRIAGDPQSARHHDGGHHFRQHGISPKKFVVFVISSGFVSAQRHRYFADTVIA
jgi:hypothetical protein